MAASLFSVIRPVALYLLVIMSGLLAGIHFRSLMAPVEQQMSVLMFTEYWQMVDGFMGQRMPYFGMAFLALFVLNLLLFIRQWRRLVFWIILLGLVLLVTDIILTGRQQIPINQYIQSVDVRNLTEQQLATLGEMKDKGRENFVFREILALVSFALLCVAPFLLHRQKA